MELNDVLLLHAGRYPLLTPQDAVKLVYQHTFGGGHLITDIDRTRARLHDELASLDADPAMPLTEPIGNGLVRVSLAAWKAREYSEDALFDAFLASSKIVAGTQERFLQDLAVLQDAAAKGLLPFSCGVLNNYLAPYIASDCPMVSHSEIYRKAYRPAYRVVREDYL